MYGEVFILQRIIAYIYRYKGDGNIYRKCGNVGFCRVEEINGRRIINMCFKETHDITRACEIEELFLARDEDNNVCKCTCGKVIRKDEICGGQMRLKLQGDKEEGLHIVCGKEKYIVLWHGDKEAILLLDRNVDEDKLEAKEITGEMFQSENWIDKKEEDKREDKNTQSELESNHSEIKKRDGFKENDQLLRAYNRMAKSPMVIENVMQQVVKLKPQQMVMLPRKYWRLTNNRFLMEGYYVHKHILFFKREDGYVIGVPSMPWEHEESVAHKFGFETCLEAYDYSRPDAPRKYWITYLN